MNNIFLVKNFFSYEEIIKPPLNLPSGFTTVYVTDSESNCDIAKNLGWNITKNISKFLNITDSFERRKSIAYINCYPHELVPEILDYNLVFVSDSNIQSLWNNYVTFVNLSNESDKALFVTSGYYNDDKDNISFECDRSGQKRWGYNHKEIKNNTQLYINDIKSKNIDVSKLSVISAKYIGWNLHHPDFKLLSDKLYEEYTKHLQGNIILTYMSGMYPDSIFNYHCNDYSGGKVNSHKFKA